MTVLPDSSLMLSELLSSCTLITVKCLSWDRSHLWAAVLSSDPQPEEQMSLWLLHEAVLVWS